jgi:DegV family protein with EDD domain
MTIRIVSDSTCDLPAEVIRANNITIVPMYINIGAKTFRDGVDLSRQEFYEQLPAFTHHPTTAAPSPGLFRQVYEQLAAEGATEILSIHISVKLSAVVEMAAQGAKETSIIPVTVFDSRQLSMGTGFEVLSAAQAAAAGRSMSEIIAILEEQITRTRTFAALDTLEFLRRSGRMNFALAFLGSLLHIKPFLKMYNGNPTAERIRTRGKAMKRLVELLQEAAPLEKVALLHSRAAERAEALIKQVRHLLPAGDIILEEINPVLGAHLGPGVVGFSVISKRS